MAYKNYPIAECAKAVEQILRARPGSAFYQKWTCAKCGERVTGDVPNKLFTQGRHEERADGTPCGHVTDIRVTGCNYAVHMVMGGIADQPTKGTA